MENVKLRIYAKINPFLSIVGSNDGYHNLDTVFVSVSAYDEILAIKSNETRVFLDGEERSETNAFKAATLMKSVGSGGAEIYITRGIISGGGVGSSSADAAGVIRALSILYDLDASEEILKTVARQVGSDVPYMLNGGWARLKGTGMEVEYFDAPVGERLLLAAKANVNTGECFRLYDENPQPCPTADEFIKKIRSSQLVDSGELLYNALTNAATMLNGDVEVALTVMKECGLITAMTGSGATVWGSGNEKNLIQAQNRLSSLGFSVQIVQTMAKGFEVL